MEGVGATNAIPIAGQPVVYGAGLVAFLVVTLSTVLGAYFHTFAHEGGHMLAIGLTARRIHGFWLEDNTEGLTTTPTVRWAFSTIAIAVAGYAAPPLLGLGGAALLAHGNVLAVLLIVAFLSLVALRFALWKTVWIVVGVVSLVAGGRLLVVA